MEVACNGTATKVALVEKQEPVLIPPAEKTFDGLYLLSNLDQTFPFRIEILFSYRKGMGNAAEIIKESLAKILVEFYPFAGCLTVTRDGKMGVRCTGEGVPFVEAISSSTIEELGDISRADPVKFRKLVHHLDKVDSILDVPPLTVQITSFRCGGIVLGIVMNHHVVDAKALADFLNSWAETTRGLPFSVDPCLDRSIISPRQPLIVDNPHPAFVEKQSAVRTTSLQFQEPIVYQSFCFEPKKLHQLKEMAKEDELVASPTSFEVISALVWIMRTKAYKIEPNKTTKMLAAVDGRRKFKPALPDCFFGNGTIMSCAQCRAGDLVQKPLSFAVKKVHESINEVNEDYIQSAIDYYELTRGQYQLENTCWISKWSSLAFYDIDFGWGKPQQVAPASTLDNLSVTLAQEKDSKNIILSLGLPESVMNIFQELMQSELKPK
ncbi:omega-hydroxypalmitate O-feruloyl transferase-like [Durio zibethinus]|uniref:Omega-hydroxypalmitate O-feruloyl transferase-like n=1 Tax=Durio zibethinus TaxID=66656 RepID=A0A6P5XEE4_DURZI|nr:omega-hydroxypalmitate O-feruloyl transferase-like [Durio zibethinus]XP_022726639.1 omega-hydroxypalmitate O-feruloyl transferase-like [Durio zibethinus]